MGNRTDIEDALRQRERELAEAQRVGQLGSWEWDMRSNQTTWSDELYRIFGLQLQEVEPTFEGFLAHVYPDDRTIITDALETLLQGETQFELICRFVRPSGEAGWMHSRGELIRDEAGEPVRMRGTALDITASKKTEEALQDTAGRYRLLGVMASAANQARTMEEALQVAVDEICAYTLWPAGHVYACSGNSPGGLELVPIWHLEDPEKLGSLPAVTESIGPVRSTRLARRVLATSAPAWTVGIDWSSETVPAGGRLAAGPGLGSAVCFPVQVLSRTAYVLEFFSDDPVGPEAALVETIGQVGTQLARVAEREQAAREVAAARDAALESSRLKSEFLATMSHEIRTPMNGVIGLTTLLIGTELDDRQRRYADGIHTAGEALMAIINDILDFSKIEAGKLDLELADFHLAQVIEDVAGLVAGPAQGKGLELVAYCHPDLPAVLRGDPARLRQVLLNLASNAVKFTEQGEVVLRARLEPGSGPSRTSPGAPVVVRFEVADSGIGIAEGDRGRLFEPFSQADSSTTRRYGGTGLGLAISHRLVSAMGGDLGFNSRAGRGSTFWFTLPLGAPPHGVVAAAGAPSRHLLDELRVLVVDDNDTNRMILRGQLEAWDMIPELAADGPSALERLREAATLDRPYSFALLDMCMPDMDGLQLARHISADPALAATRLVLLTSRLDVSVEEARQAGISARLTKPVRLSQLYDTLVRVAAPPLAATPSGLPPPSAAHAPGSRGQVLVVEDNAINKMVAVGILCQMGYRVDVAGNGLEALAALERTDYVAVFMDCQMPDMDGFEATGEIRRREGRARHTPIIAMTAGAVEGDRERCLAAGMDDYISKPVKPDKVGEALAAWAGNAPGKAISATGADTGACDNAAPEETIDHSQVEMLREMGLLEELAELFLRNAHNDLVAVRESVNEGDAAAVAVKAHRLRGAAATIGATGAAELYYRLEKLGIEQRLEAAPGLLTRLAAELDRVADALRGTAPSPP